MRILQIIENNWGALLFTEDLVNKFIKPYWFKCMLLILPENICIDIKDKSKVIFEHVNAVWWLKYTLTVIVAIVALALWVQMTRDTDTPNKFALGVFNFFNNWALVLSTSVMLMLAVAALLAILDNRRGRRLDRRERLLNEIIEWATSIVTCGLAMDTRDVETFYAGLGFETYKKLSADSLLCKFNLIEAGTKYTRTITSELFKDSQLEDDIKAVIINLHNHIKLLDLASDDKVKDREAIGRHREILNNSARKVIEEATKIKTRDVG